MSVSYEVNSTAERTEASAGLYPPCVSASEYDDLKQAISILNSLWFVEEAYDAVLQNGIELQTDVARLVAQQGANVSSFPDEVDVELRLLNRRLTNFLASARSFIDSVKIVLSRGPRALNFKAQEFGKLLSKEFDSQFSYRLMEALRNHTQHQGAAVRQALVMYRTWRSREDEVRVPSLMLQIQRDALVCNKSLNAKVRAEIGRTCDSLIDIMPHLRAYMRCFENVVDKMRSLYEPEHKWAVETQVFLLKGHLEHLPLTPAHSLRR